MSTKAPSRHGRGSKFNVSEWPLRRKLALALLIPLLLAATLGGLRVRSDLDESANSSSSADQVTVLRPAVAYLTVAERAMVAAQAGSDTDPVDLDAAVSDLKTAANRLSAARDSADLTPEQDHQVDVVLDLSRALREGSTDTLSPGTWVAQLRQLQSGVTQLIATIGNAQNVPEPRLELLAQTLGGRFSLAMQQALVATDRSGDTGSLELFSELGVEGAAIDRLASSLGASEPAVAALRTDNAQRSRTVRTGGTDLGGPDAYTEYDALAGKLMNGIDDQLAASAADARNRAVLNAGITLAALLAALLLAFLVSRLLLTPIRKVREGALAVAHEQLPEAVAKIRSGEDPGAIQPIDVTTHEEMGQMARAVDDMHRQAVLLASEEANLRAQVGEMFVTLSRRNTSLINQQLGLIEALEKDEEDPRRLESLFRLDHLASRMRRTADSLLILADAPAPATGQDGLTVADSLQAATAGVQDYQRVRVGATSSARITDAAAADVVHLLTELVDNALAYSAPSTTVGLASVTGRDGVTIEVTDEGLGIPDNALKQINENLRSGAEVTPDTARRMGLFVVSRLAQRHQISVSLRRNEKGGTTATVFLPSAILPGSATAAASPTRPVGVPETNDPAPTREPAPAAAVPVAQGVESIEDRINGALGLPRRQPGTTLSRPDAPAAMPAASAPAASAPASSAPSAPAIAAPPGGVPAALGSGLGAAAVSAAGATATSPEVSETVENDVPADVIPIRPLAVAPPVGQPEPADELDEERESEDELEDQPEDQPEDQSDDRQEPAGDLEDELEDELDPVSDPDPEPEPEPESGPTSDEETDEETDDEPVPVWAAGPACPAAAVREPEVVREPEPSRPERAPETRPVPVAALRPVGDALDGALEDDGDADLDTPIFKSMQSAWLSATGGDQPWRSSEVEAGWDRADKVAEASIEPQVSPSGLPVRRPGTKLIPGGVTKPPTVAARDPEAIRKRLAAHAAGVSRGRSAAATSPHPQHTEAGPA